MRNGPLFFFAALFFLMLDLVLNAYLFGAQFFFSRCFFYATVATSRSLWRIGFAGFLALVPTFLATGLLGADLVVMLPLGLGLYQLCQVIDLPRLFKGCAVFACFLLHFYLINYLMMGVSLAMGLVLVHFLVALIMVYL